MAMQSATATGLTDDDGDEFFDAVGEAFQGTLTQYRGNHEDSAEQCEHDDDRRTCAMCALTDDVLVESDPVIHDQTEQQPLSLSPTPYLAPTLPTASAEPVVTLFGHNAAAFGCTLCPFSGRQMANLHRHRRSCHRSVTFVDDFHANCDCDAVFAARSAATLHAVMCRGEQRRRPAERVDAATLSRNSASGTRASSPIPARDVPLPCSRPMVSLERRCPPHPAPRP
ncbi:hypothetical protein PR003_g25189 [Phytophthora rubi]|uniref:Uncharacterized protein n=1 Tax=Phytophthora rubi TaxID=129364 RepID=A0A6A3IAM0_9STRA|nr:hypothetical protein PR002_g24288 [Phytophthora rubi]KAE8981994.1 hypothetical protein PR001_g23843 [Phytophthora rubi]KAE9290839.1 hypothetical protein PR003_g25189 [Phytophthora rubi]